MGRQPCCDKIGLKRGPWTIEEDHKLMSFILYNGIQCWRMVPKLAGLLRCGKSCRLRWINYLRPDLKRGVLSEMEEEQIIELHARLGNRWSKIASHFPGRTDNEIKNHWNTRIKKRLKLQGLDPITHQPVEQKRNVEEKNKPDTESNLQNEQEKVFDVSMQGNTQITAEEAKDDEMNGELGVVTSCQSELTNDFLISNYEMMCTSLDMDLWMTNEESNKASTSYSPSFSLEESVYRNSGGESVISIHEQTSSTLQQWVESVDSMLYWDGFDQLDQFHQQANEFLSK
ncbi:hypothetical protein BUALT_Bualt04G0168100 [Buddleja alternifolia]|uniref:Uncharacterized protein n=1 Tax=Buddleja alternifolia TaxID=168488 RepID=A0AAV6XR20_9LAMI|nr:hypothetical protein BUALT_Bualt04G0168100 [Buddleja alternifolia]